MQASLEDLLERLHVVVLPMRVPFRGLIVREVALIDGPAGWGEFGAFLEYQPPEAALWLAAGIESAYRGWPSGVRTTVAINATVPAVPARRVPEVLARFPGATTAKVKVAEAGQTLAEDVARVEAVRALVPTVRVDANGGWSVEQAVTAAAGALLVLALAGMPAAFAVAPPLAAGLAAGALAFLPRNWPPARVFLGDVGSIPLGYLLAWLLLALAYAGHAVPALILPLYFVFDATFTLLSRLLRGASVFDAHSEHLYQRARRGGKSHLWVTVRALAANVLFAGLAVLAVRFPFSALLAASPVLVGLAAIYLCAARTRPVSADRLGRP